MIPPCDYCGEDIDTTVWYPIVTKPNDDNGIDLFSFCDEDCQQAWETDRNDIQSPSH